MSGRDIEVLVASWQDIGLEPFSEVDGKKTWKDFCVVEGLCCTNRLNAEFPLSPDGLIPQLP